MPGHSVPKTFKLGPGAAGSNKNIYDTAGSVASGSSQNIVTYTVPAGKKFFLSIVEFGGQNIANFEFLLDNVIEAKKRTWFNGPFFGEFFFNNLELSAGQKIDLKVENFRPTVADFEGRILGSEQDE